MGKFTDISGQVFGNWTILKHIKNVRGGAVYECVCACGCVKEIHRCNLVSGKTKSCGCAKPDFISSSRKTHGHSRGRSRKASKVYNTWSSMITRCTNENSHAYSRYGGRGIIVCERWKVFENFLFDMGEPEPWQSIDRIDNNGNYEPGNCRWADSKTQARNNSKTKLNASIVERIRLGELTESQVREMTGCCSATFFAAKNGVNWK